MTSTDFRLLVKNLNKLEKTSKKIIKNALDIMNKLKDDDNEILENAMDDGNLEDDKKQVLLDTLRDLSLKWIRDAEIVLAEVPKFVVDEDGVYIVDLDSGECPFLNEVWNGDYYDQTENEGLTELLKDLEGQLEDINEEKLIANALKMV